MRVAISLLNFRPAKIGGAETYIRRLCAALPEVAAPADAFTFITYREIAGAVTLRGAAEVVVERTAAQITQARALEAFSPYRAAWAERAVAEAQPDVVFYPQQSMFPKRCPYPSVVAIMDLQHIALPQNFSLADRAFRAAIYPYSLRRATRLVAISEFTRQEVIKHYGIRPESIAAAPLGFEGEHPPREPVPELPERYWYYPAMTFPHKNHVQLFRTLTELRRGGEFRGTLVLSGGRTSYWPKLEQEITRLNLQDVVKHLGYLSRGQVATVYANCEGVFFPSLYEGFGLPLLEAVSWRKKVIVSPLPVFQEQGVPAQWQVDYRNAAALLAAMRQDGATELTISPATWTDCAQRTLAVLRAAAAEGRSK